MFDVFVYWIIGFFLFYLSLIDYFSQIRKNQEAVDRANEAARAAALRDEEEGEDLKMPSNNRRSNDEQEKEDDGKYKDKENVKRLDPELLPQKPELFMDDLAPVSLKHAL